MEHNSSAKDQPLRIPPIAWFLGLGLIAALVAIFVFNVTLNAVVSYGFVALTVVSHLFMHRSHGGDGGHPHRSTSNNTDSSNNEHSGHAGGCH